MSRPETGPMQFGDDWCGIFVRGDNALLYYANQLRMVLESNKDTLDYMSVIALKNTISLFEGANHFQQDSEKQMMKSFEECVKKNDQST